MISIILSFITLILYLIFYYSFYLLENTNNKKHILILDKVLYVSYSLSKISVLATISSIVIDLLI